ncbi:histone H4-like [Rana temporaria]|uniref:histone H4-like n=1 Tax=Rana temporaria TaxID=8407 RepID=UPI001AAD4CE6|nr:histone H4-like [Rana temporaria]
MSGHGKGGKGLGKGCAKHHRKVLWENIQGITKKKHLTFGPQKGVKCISRLIYEDTCRVIIVFLENIIRNAFTYPEHGKRKTVAIMDVFYALKCQGSTFYGFRR